MPIGSRGKRLIEIGTKMQQFSFSKMNLKMPSAKCRIFCFRIHRSLWKTIDCWRGPCVRINAHTRRAEVMHDVIISTTCKESRVKIVLITTICTTCRFEEVTCTVQIQSDWINAMHNSAYIAELFIQASPVCIHWASGTHAPTGTR